MKLNVDAARPAAVPVSETELKRQLAANLKWLRSVDSIPQRVLADYLNIDRSTYCYYETEKTLPAVVTLKQIADFYNLTVDDLLSKDLNKRNF